MKMIMNLVFFLILFLQKFFIKMVEEVVFDFLILRIYYKRDEDDYMMFNYFNIKFGGFGEYLKNYFNVKIYKMVYF